MSMESNYQELNKESLALMQELGRNEPELMKSFQGLHHAAIGADALDSKAKELIALAIGISTRCQRCIGLHVAAALKEGASEDEIRETVAVATMMGGGPALMYGLDALKALKELA
ncbi:MAG: carboxymuconolactone decarboxylase family protein [Puniceicoccaceae bacterium]